MALLGAQEIFFCLYRRFSEPPRKMFAPAVH